MPKTGQLFNRSASGGAAMPDEGLRLDAVLSASLQQARDQAGSYTPFYLATGGAKFEAQAAGDIGLIIKGAAAQTANLLEGHDSAATVVASISSAGLVTSSGALSQLDGNNASVTPLILRNTSAALTGETGDAVRLSFELMGTTDDGVSYVAHEGASLRAVKLGDWYRDDATETDHDTTLDIWTTLDGVEKHMARFGTAYSQEVKFARLALSQGWNPAGGNNEWISYPGQTRYVFGHDLKWSSSTTNAGAGSVALALTAVDTGTAIMFDISTGGGIRVPAGTATDAPILMGVIGIFQGTGTPESGVTAPVGALFIRTDGGAGTSLYVKETGTGNTGWVGK